MPPNNHNRERLQSLFQNNKRLSQSHFSELINSMLDRQDDQFHGLWRKGRVYKPGDVVIHDRQLWEMGGPVDICAKSDDEAPDEAEPIWQSFLDDNDWAVPDDENVMWAKVFEKVGIGVGNDEGERPLAQLDIRKAKPDSDTAADSQPSQPTGAGRWLLFPEQAPQTQQTFLHYGPNDGSQEQTSALITGLSLEAATWSSNALHGFTFRHNDHPLDEDSALKGKATDGDVMMVIRPNQAQPKLATLGLNVEIPTALLDITNRQWGQFLVLPEAQLDPTFSLLHLGTDAAQSTYHFTAGINSAEMTLKSNAKQGFSFRLDDGYRPGQSQSPDEPALVRIRQDVTGLHPQVGIGTDSPAAYLDICDRAPQTTNQTNETSDTTRNSIQLLPIQTNSTDVAAALPIISIISQLSDTASTYLYNGLGEQSTDWVTNAAQGYRFRQITDPALPPNPELDQGDIQLAIQADGHIGMGTGQPATSLEIASKSEAGRFFCHLGPNSTDPPVFSILKHRENDCGEPLNTYFNLVTHPEQSVLSTNASEGFTFKAGPTDRTKNPYLEADHGKLLVNISPDGNGRLGIGKKPDNYELDVQGLTQALTFYQVIHPGWVSCEAPLTDTLEKLKCLHPITFEWSDTSGFSTEGEQIGLQPQDVCNLFPQVVKTGCDGSPSLAYQNLVPVLIQAINELNEQNQKEHYQLEQTFKQLANRIAILAVGLFVGWVIALFGYWG